MPIMEDSKCLYDKWVDNEPLNLNRFTITLFQAFQYADGANRQKILAAWGDFFTGSNYI